MSGEVEYACKFCPEVFQIHYDVRPARSDEQASEEDRLSIDMVDLIAHAWMHQYQQAS